MTDLYEELGVSIDADENTIRAAYRRRSIASRASSAITRTRYGPGG